MSDAAGRREDRWADWARAAEDPRRAAEKPEALDGLLVLDCAVEHYGGHVLGGFLGELGAEVVKLEPPGGDPARAWGPADASLRGEGLAYLAEGRNRYYATLDLTSPDGQALFRQLATRADVVIEGFPPGQMDAWGIGYRQLEPLNSRLVYVALSTHGQFGPRAEGSGPEYDLIDQALSGLAYITGEPGEGGPETGPTRVGSWISAYAQAAWGGVATLAALHWREASGARPDDRCLGRRGPDALPRVHAAPLPRQPRGARAARRDGHRGVGVHVHPGEGWLGVHRRVHRSEFRRRSAGSWGARSSRRIPGSGRRSTGRSPQARAALRDEIGRWSVNYTASEILAKVLADPGPGTIVFGPVNQPTQTLAEDHWWDRGCFARLDDPLYGPLTLAAPAWRMTRTPPRLKVPGPAARIPHRTRLCAAPRPRANSADRPESARYHLTGRSHECRRRCRRGRWRRASPPSGRER